MPDKEFLENYPLYKKLVFGPKQNWEKYQIERLPKPSINMFCGNCSSIQTYNAINNYDSDHGWERNKVSKLLYECAGCGRDVIGIVIKFDEWSEYNEQEKEHKYYLQIQKVGQFPAWSIDMDKELEKILGKHAEIYKNGLVCESQSYGIGAYAYFRRITEDVIEELVSSVSELLEKEDEREIYKKALEEVKKTKVTEKKIELVQDLMPISLKADGINPLKALHGALSIGLHGKTDQECMELAAIIRDSLVYLVNQIRRTKEEKKKFTDGIKKLLMKHSI